MTDGDHWSVAFGDGHEDNIDEWLSLTVENASANLKAVGTTHLICNRMENIPTYRRQSCGTLITPILTAMGKVDCQSPLGCQGGFYV